MQRLIIDHKNGPSAETLKSIVEKNKKFFLFEKKGSELINNLIVHVALFCLNHTLQAEKVDQGDKYYFLSILKEFDVLFEKIDVDAELLQESQHFLKESEEKFNKLFAGNNFFLKSLSGVLGSKIFTKFYGLLTGQNIEIDITNLDIAKQDIAALTLHKINCFLDEQDLINFLKLLENSFDKHSKLKQYCNSEEFRKADYKSKIKLLNSSTISNDIKAFKEDIDEDLKDKLDINLSDILEFKDSRTWLLQRKTTLTLKKSVIELNKLIGLGFLPDSLQNKILENTRGFFRGYINIDELLKVFSNSNSLEAPIWKINDIKIDHSKTIQLKKRYIVVLIFAMSVLTYLNHISFISFAIAACISGLVYRFLINNKGRILSWDDLKKEVTQDKFPTLYNLMGGADSRIKILKVEEIRVIRQELRENKIDESLADKYFYKYASKMLLNQEIEYNAHGQFVDLYNCIQEISTKLQMKYIDHAILALGKDVYWNDDKISLMVSGFGLSPYSSVGQRIFALARAHNFFILSCKKNNIFSAIGSDLLNLRLFGEISVVKDYLSTFSRANETYNISGIVTDIQNAETITNFSNIIDDIKEKSGIVEHVSKETVDDLSLLIKAFKGNEISDHKRLIKLLETDEKYLSRLHQQNDIVEVLTSTSDLAHGTIKRDLEDIRNLLPLSDAINYFHKFGDYNNVSNLIKNGRELIWHKISVISGRIESVNLQKIGLKNKKLEDWHKKSQEEDPITRGLCNHVLKPESLEADDFLDFKEETSQRLNNLFSLLKSSDEMYFWISSLLIGFGLIIPAVVTKATIDFILASVFISAASLVKIHESYENKQTLQFATEHLKTEKVRAISESLELSTLPKNEHVLG